MRTPLAVLVTGCLILPSAVPAQMTGSAAPAARPVASAFVLTLASFPERRDYLAERVEGWKTMIPEGSSLAKDFLPEIAALKAQLGAMDDPAALVTSAFVVDAFETRLMERLNPKMASMDAESRREARELILQKKEALVALNRRRMGADSRTAKQIDGLKKDIKQTGFSMAGLSTLFDRTRSLTGASVAPSASAFSAAAGMGSFSDWSYPRPDIPQRAYGSMAVPEPGGSAPITQDEAKVVAAAQANGLNATIVRQAYRESQRQGVDFRMVLAVIEAESAYNPRATSGVGAKGLMQIMPATGRGLGVRDSNMLYDAATNIRAGVKYLKGLWEQFSDVAWSEIGSINPFTRADVKAAIAAYNAGPGAVQKYGGVPPYRETRGYVVKVLSNFQKYDRMFPD